MDPLITAPLALTAASAGFVGAYGTAVYRYQRYHAHTSRIVPGAMRVWRTHTDELVAYLTIGAWQVANLLMPAGDEPALIKGPPVLCVHGFSQTGANFVGLRAELRHIGRPTLAIRLGTPPRSIERYAAPLAQHLNALAQQRGQVDLVAHSMGGVVLRYVLAEQPDLRGAVRRIVTLGSPHRGTAATRGALGRFFPEVDQMSRRSSWLADLPTFAETVPNAQVTTIASDTDTVVYPRETSHLPGATMIDLTGIGHAGLLTSRAVRRLVLDAIER